MTHHPLTVLMRFFCSRCGTALARAAILAWSVIGAGVGWVALEIWDEFKATRAAVVALQTGFAAFAAGASQRGAETARRVGDAEYLLNQADTRMDGLDRRISRVEGARR